MMARILQMLWLLALALPAAGEFEHGPRPPGAVFDPTGFLEPELAAEISGPLGWIYEREGIDVIVVILPELGSAPPELVARRFAEAWCESMIHCVVLHVPAREDGPWIVPAGRLVEHLNPTSVRQGVADGERRAGAEPTEPEQVKAAATEAADLLRYWMGSTINRSEMIKTERTRMRLELETKARRMRVITLAAVASFIPVVAGVSLLIHMLRRRGPAYFPHPAWQLRLGAPHAGGNNAVADLGPLS